MILCLTTNILPDGTLQLSATQLPQVADCTTGYVAVQAVDYVSLSTLGTLFQTYFAFDDVLFSEIVGWSLVSFAIGHGLGRMMQVWRKGL
jgi:hypothetical protein